MMTRDQKMSYVADAAIRGLKSLDACYTRASDAKMNAYKECEQLALKKLEMLNRIAADCDVTPYKMSDWGVIRFNKNRFTFCAIFENCRVYDVYVCTDARDGLKFCGAFSDHFLRVNESAWDR